VAQQSHSWIFGQTNKIGSSLARVTEEMTKKARVRGDEQKLVRRLERDSERTALVSSWFHASFANAPLLTVR
jgi:hypothetical protein